MAKTRKDVQEVLRRLNEVSPRASFVVKSEEAVEDWKLAFERMGFVCEPLHDGRRVGYECSNGRAPPQRRSVKVLRWVQSPREEAKPSAGAETEADQEKDASEAVEEAREANVPSAGD